MAKRGEASARFSATKETNGKNRGSWEVIHDSRQLLLVFPDPELSLPSQSLDLTNWLAVGSCAVEFAEAFARHYSGSRRTTRYNSAKSFYYGFITFTCDVGIKLNQAAEAEPLLLQKFIAWLKHYQGAKNTSTDEAEDNRTDQTQVANPWTRVNLWKPCKAVFQELQRCSTEGTWAVEIPRNPFAGEKFIPSAKKDSDVKQYIDFLALAASDALELMNDVGSHFDAIARAIKRIENGGKYNSTKVDDVVAKVLVTYGWIVPERKYLLKHDPVTFQEISTHGYTEVCRLAHPQFSDLVPFLYLLAGHTGFNQQPLTYLQLDQICESSIFGVSRMTLSPEKFRAGSIVRRSFVRSDEKLAVTVIIDFILEWTKYLRRIAPDFAKDDLWLFANKMKSGSGGNNPVRSLASKEKNNQNELSNHLLRYCKRKKFKFKGLREIRLSFSDLFLRANPGDLEGLRILLGQRWISTTANHYRTQQAYAEGQELLAGAMSMQQRWIGSEGKIDTRTTGENRERTAATPGFICLDPFDSPAPGQQKGRMCEAYGICPACPLAATDSDAPYALARFHQLAAEYEKAKLTLGAEIWRRKYQGCYEALATNWIPALSTSEIATAAGKLHLPRLPDLE